MKIIRVVAEIECDDFLPRRVVEDGMKDALRWDKRVESVKLTSEAVA